MTEKYSFIISEDFPNQKVDLDKLTNELTNSLEANLEYINISSGICDIWFESEISSADSTSLLSIVTSHDGEPYNGINCAYLISTESSVTNSTKYITRNNFTLENIMAGDYEIKWYFEYSYADARTRPSFRVQVDNTTIAEFGKTPSKADDEWNSRTGFAFVSLTAGNHNINISYKSGRFNRTVRIRRVRVGLKIISGTRTTIVKELEHIEFISILC